MKMTKAIFAAVVGLGLWSASASASAPNGVCGLERGYIVCHDVSARQQTVNLSFVPNRVIRVNTYQALICSTNPSGVKSVHGEQAQPGGGNGFDARVASHSEACTDITNLNFTPADAWKLTVDFNDGDAVTFYFNVVD